ncbi:MAG TPA: lysophospholipase [bacterium]|nr:lysophospholipase [bacterium]
MKEEEGKFSGAGGLEIFWRAWLPDPVRAVCMICHGLGEHSGRYAEVAADLAQKGLASFALDHRGHGRSGGKRGHVLAFSEFLDDLDSFRRLVEARAAGKPVFLIGHSMGGLIAARYAEQSGAGLRGLVLSSAALRVDVDAPAIKLAAGRFFSKYLPGLTMGNGLDPQMISHDKKVVDAYIADPLVHDRVSARWFTEFTAAIEAVQKEAGKITIPVLCMQSGDDKLVAPRGAPEFFERLTVKDKKLQVWDGFYHEMFNEVERAKPAALMLEWIEEHLR